MSIDTEPNISRTQWENNTYKLYNTRKQSTMSLYTTFILVISIAKIGFCESPSGTDNVTEGINTSEVSFTPELFTQQSVSVKNTTEKILQAISSFTPSTTKQTIKTEAPHSTTESSTTIRYSTTHTYVSTKAFLKTARWQKLNTTSSTLENAVHSSSRFQERLGAVDCDLPVLPRESRLWRGNETHELNFPVTVREFLC